MITLLETPVPIILLGIAAEVVLLATLLLTGRGVVLVGMVGTVVLVAAGVGLEWLVVTQREQVEAEIYQIAVAFEANDLDAVLGHCSTSAVHSRSEARRAFDLVQFTKLKITELKIERIGRQADPPTTKAHFVVMVSATDRDGSFGHVTRPIWFNLDFRLEGDRWMITGHELENAPCGF